MKNENEIRAAAEEIAAELCTGCHDRKHRGFADGIAELLRKHFGESAPEQNVARIYADGRWLHAECLLCEWSGVKWKARRGSGLPNAKAILQHSLRDHLLFKHVEKLPVLAPSVDTNAERCYGDHHSRKVVPADAPQEPMCARCGYTNSARPHPWRRQGPSCDEYGCETFTVESSVLPSKSEPMCQYVFLPSGLRCLALRNADIHNKPHSHPFVGESR